MATIVNPDQVGQSVRSKADILRIQNETYARVLPKVKKLSTAKVAGILPRTKLDSRDHKARAAKRAGIARAARTVLQDRGIEITEAMYGGTIPNGDYRGEYRAVPGL